MRRDNQKIEGYFFLFITFLNLSPILLGKFFPTLDGAEHLYKSNLINEVLFKNNIKLNPFFPELISLYYLRPANFILCFFNFFLPAFIAEKVLVLLYLIGLPLSFRILINNLTPNNLMLSYFIFPFCYSFLFILGFYNFSLAIIFLILTINYWFINENKSFSVIKTFKLFSLILLTYLSHIFVFGILIMLILLNILWNIFYGLLINYKLKKLFLKQALVKICLLLFTSLIPFCLFIYYFYSKDINADYTFIHKRQLLEWLKDIRPIIGYNLSIEEAFTKKIFYLIAILLLIAVYNRINSTTNQNKLKENRNFISLLKIFTKKNDFWLLSAGVVLFLYFTLPNQFQDADFISHRFGYLFFIFLIIWLSVQTIPNWLGLFIVSILLFCHFNLLYYYSKVIWNLNKTANNYANVAEHISKNSNILSINYSKHWMHLHFPKYLGIDKPLIILNRETTINNPILNDIPIVNYIILSTSIDNSSNYYNQNIEQVIKNNYDLIYKNKECELFRKKSN